MIRNLLSNLIIWVYGLYRKITDKPDFKIESRSLEYTIDHEKEYQVGKGGFWDKESKSWDDGILNEYWVDVTDIPYYDEKLPENVEHIILRIRYWYGNKQYKFITTNVDTDWPVPLKEGISFSIPLTSAMLLDYTNKPVRDITSKIKKYAGPRSDFHGEDVPICDMLRYNISVLKEEFPKIKLTNAIGMTKIVTSYEDDVKSLRIP
tara:strand:- start:3617 stop:4234 length:618 start_codon:yes stop_codon:yes gene_type:complete